MATVDSLAAVTNWERMLGMAMEYRWARYLYSK